MTPSAWYRDWQFWAFFIAALALLVSLAPHLYRFLRKGRLKCQTLDSILINHEIGHPSGQWHVLLENTGGRPLSITSMQLVFACEAHPSFVMPVRGYFEKPDSQSALLFSPFKLSAGEQWGHIINFFVPATREEDRITRPLKARVKANILALRAAQPNTIFATEDTDAVERLTQLMNHRFKWLHGEYTVELRITVDDADFIQRFGLVLFETDSQELRDYAHGYKFGAGVYYSNDAGGLLVPIRQR